MNILRTKKEKKQLSTPGKIHCIFTGLFSLYKGKRNALPGIEFDLFGRTLAVREFLETKNLTANITSRIANPVSCVRYFEFAYAGNAVTSHMHEIDTKLSVIDISSPRLFPFWMAEKKKLSVNMINPDSEDLFESKKKVRFVHGNRNIEFFDGINAAQLPFNDNSFDMATSISVIEHVPDNGDSWMITELRRVVCSGGVIILTFPVKPEFENEYRETSFYNRDQASDGNGRYFFQRYYSEAAIRERILIHDDLLETDRRYWVEKTPDWFAEYEKKWMENGLQLTVFDPELMAKHFIFNNNIHPVNGMGICCMTLVNNKH